jgi:hypothetical protein
MSYDERTSILESNPMKYVAAFILAALPALAASAGDADVTKEMSVLRDRIAKAAAAGKELSGIALFSGEKCRVRVVKADGENVRVRIFKFNDLEMNLPWSSMDVVATALCAKPAVAASDTDGTLALLAVLRAAGAKEADDVYGTINKSGDEKLIQAAREVWNRFTPGGGTPTVANVTPTNPIKTEGQVKQPVTPDGPVSSSGREWFVSPAGKPTNEGTKTSPWDLYSTLEAKHKPVKPGDAIVLLDGVYKRRPLPWCDVSLAGKPDKHIVVRPAPGARAVIDGGLFMDSDVASLSIIGLEIMASEQVPKTPVPAGQKFDHPGGGVFIYGGKGIRLINLDIHDVLNPVTALAAAVDVDIYGCLIRDFGFLGADRGHCHAVYLQNKDGFKTVSNCIMSARYDGQWSVHAYSANPDISIAGIVCEDNAVIGKGPILIGHAASPVKAVKLRRNRLFNADMQVGFATPANEDCEVKDNLLAGGALKVNHFKSPAVDSNADKLPAQKSFLVPNKFDPDRAHLVIANGAKSPAVAVDISSFIKPGESYRIIDPKDIHGKPVAEGAGQSASVPMSGEFAAFVVFRTPKGGDKEKTGSVTPAAPTQENGAGDDTADMPPKGEMEGDAAPEPVEAAHAADPSHVDPPAVVAVAPPPPGKGTDLLHLPADYGAPVKLPTGGEFYVGPDGRPGNAGTKSSPWDMASALDGKKLQPGATVNVLAGTYKRGTGNQCWFPLKQAGAPGRPVVIRAAPGARATIQGGIIIKDARTSNVWIMGIEMVGAEAIPKGTASIDKYGGGGLFSYAGTGNRFINLDIHDVPSPLLDGEAARETEIYGCLIHDNGFQGSDRGHGHCIYSKNGPEGVKIVAANILSTRYDGQWSMHAYTEAKSTAEKKYIQRYLAEDNIVNGKGPFLIGAVSMPTSDLVIRRNYVYGANMMLGWASNANGTAEIQDNIFAKGKLKLNNFSKAVQAGNLTAAPAFRAVVIPNRYDPNRANAAVFNASRSGASLPVGAFLKPGDSYRVQDAKDFFGKPLAEGKCAGGSITVPMSGDFGAFVIIKQ